MISKEFVLSSIKLLRKRKRRLFTSFLGAVFAITLIVNLVVLFSNMDFALKKQKMDQYGSLDLMVGFQAGSEKKLTQEQIELIKSIPGIDAIGKSIVNIGLDFPDQRPEVFSKIFTAIDNSDVTLGAFKIDNPLQRDEVVISSSLTEYLNKNVNDIVELPLPNQMPRKFKITQIIDVTTLNAVSDSVYISMELFELLYGNKMISNPLLVELNPEAKIEEITMYLKDLVSPELQIIHLDNYGNEQGNIQNLRLMSYIFASIALITAAMFILSNFLLSIRERYRDFALLRTIGAKRIQLFFMIWIETFLLGALASIAGLGLGLGISSMLHSFISQWLGLHITNFYIPWKQCIEATMLCWGFLQAISTYPAWKAGRTLPMALIRESFDLRQGIKPTRYLITIICGIVGLVLLLIGFLLEQGNESSMRALMFLLGGLLITLTLFSAIPFGVKPVFHFANFFISKLLGSFGRHSLIAVRNLIAERKQSTMTIAVLAMSPLLFFSISIFLSSLQNSMLTNLYQAYVTEIRITHQLGPGSDMYFGKAEEISSLPNIESVIPVSFVEIAALKDFSFERSNSRWSEENKVVDSIHDLPKRELLAFKLVDLQSLINLGELPSTTGDLTNQVYMTKDYADQLGVKKGDKIKITRNGELGYISIGGLVEKLPLILSDSPEFILADWGHSVLSLPSLSGKEINVESFLVMDKKGYREGVMNDLRNLFISDKYIKINDMEMEIMNLELQMKQRVFVLYAITAVVWIIGLLGGMTTISANLLAKRREYAILRAIYVTPSQLTSIVIIQCAIFGFVSFIFGASVGIFLSKVFTSALEAQFIINFELLAWMIMGSGLAFLITLVQPWLFSREVGKEGISKALRLE